jgi:tRNA(Ile)-lysidine synthase
VKIEVKPGKYIVAVSGGVDSVVLLELLTKKPDLELIVAHFNHGIRQESEQDEELVRHMAGQLGLLFEVSQGKLGRGVSEDAARQARYEFLYAVQKKYRADAIMTAHHQDDLIETALINLLRGTGRKGLVAIINNENVLRPLLSYSKLEILEYVKKRGLNWREDTTNNDETYLRNYVRKHLVADLDLAQRVKIVKNVEKVAKMDKNIDILIATLSQHITNSNKINRDDFANLPVNLGNELVVFWLRQNQVRGYDKKTVNRLNVALKTAKPATTCVVQGDLRLLIGKKTAQFVTRV